MNDLSALPAGAPSGDRALRLAPEMASFKLLVLRFLREYFAANGASPSYGEIASALGTNRERVRQAVRKLVAAGLLLRTPGERGLALPEDEAAAVRRLRELGWHVEEHARIAARSLTIHSLSDAQVLDYSPGGSEGTDNGETGRQAGPGQR